MNITCPSCAKRYKIDDASIKPGGRKVRCASCGNRWHVDHPDDAAETDEDDGDIFGSTPDVVDQSASAEEADAGDGDGEATPDDHHDDHRDDEPEEAVPAEAVAAPLRRRGAGLAITGWLLVLLVVIGLAGAVVGRNEIVDRYPQTERYYQLAGLPITRQVGLEIRAIETKTNVENGMAVLVVQGEVHNPSGREREVPPVRVGLLDDSHAEVDFDRVAAEQSLLPPEGMTRFELRFVAPPPTAKNFSITFDTAPSDLLEPHGGTEATAEAATPAATATH